MYCISESYTHREDIKHHDDRSFTDGWQDYVYKKARQILEENEFSKVLDVGCGSGFKLMKYFSEREIVGLEVEPSLSFLRGKYPHEDWRKSDFDNLPEGSFDIVICSDVIEHIPDADLLLDFLLKIDCKYLIISTPDREQLKVRDNGDGYLGPPLNPCHCREWTKDEFSSYIGSRTAIYEHITYVPETSQAVICRR